MKKIKKRNKKQVKTRKSKKVNDISNIDQPRFKAGNRAGRRIRVGWWCHQWCHDNFTIDVNRWWHVGRMWPAWGRVTRSVDLPSDPDSDVRPADIILLTCVDRFVLTFWLFCYFSRIFRVFDLFLYFYFLISYLVIY